MAAGVNKVLLIGHLGRDPEVRYTSAGLAIAKLSLATTEKRKKGDQWEDQTEWHRVTVFGKLAEICGEYLTKGSLVFIEGRIHYGSYEKDGQTVGTVEILADAMRMLGGGKDASPGAAGGPRTRPSAGDGGKSTPRHEAAEEHYSVEEDDIPF